MATITAVEEGPVGAPAPEVYGYLADTRHHREFLPPAFGDFVVEEGGTGEGTVVSFTVTAGGRSRAYRMRIAEPQPGRVLTETDANSSLVTTFTVVPDGAACRVRIATTWQGAGGVGGFFERRFAPGALRRIYREELVLLDAYARRQAAGGSAAGAGA